MNAQNELDVIRNNWLQYSDAPNSFYHFLTSEAFELFESRASKISQIKTNDEMLERQAEVRQTMWEILGPFPEKTPLNAKITSTFKKNGYRVENVIYESLPGFYVTASLLFPKMSRNQRQPFYSVADIVPAFTDCRFTSYLFLILLKRDLLSCNKYFQEAQKGEMVLYPLDVDRSYFWNDFSIIWSYK
jgi:hypothetical protein